MKARPSQRQIAYENALQNAWNCRNKGRAADEFRFLEQAHVLGQSYLLSHWRVHLLMLGYGIRQRSGREIVGQVWRILLTPLGHLTGRLPVGNTGGANISAFARLPISDDLQRVLDDSGVDS